MKGTVMTEFHVLIPARLASQRLKKKALLDIHGAPLVARVFECAQRAQPKSVHVVTDSEAIGQAIEIIGGSVVMTSPDHRSGTDRLCEAVTHLALRDQDIVVNLQGDEPMMPVECLNQVAEVLAQNPAAEMATLYEPLASEAQWQSPDVVKLVTTSSGHALCFSRAPIPHPRNGGWPRAVARRHVGLYAYRVDALKRWGTLPDSDIEAVEGLEQWRALTAGWSIVCARAVCPIPPGVDTQADIDRVRLEW